MVVYSDEMTRAEMVALCLGISSCNQKIQIRFVGKIGRLQLFGINKSNKSNQNCSSQ